MRYLGPDEVRAALPMAACIAAMEAAFGPDRETPVRAQLGASLYMPGRVGEYSGIKVVSTVPGNPVGVVVVFGSDGTPLGACDGATVTAIRTAAAPGLATRLLARPDSETMAMLGAGAMAADQIEAVRAVRDIKTVYVWSRSRERAERLAAAVGGEAVTEADEAVAAADVVNCATPATAPLFGAESVREGTHINAVGAFRPEMVEVPPEVVQQAFVVVDDIDAAREEAGDLIQAGVVPATTLGDLLAGEAAAGGEPYTLFKSVGIASQDVAAAVAALERAEGI